MNAKQLGPFTGRQLTTIACVVAAAVLFPVGAFAVSGSNSFITDATSGKRAKVDAAGNLQTKSNTLAPTATNSFYGSWAQPSGPGATQVPNIDRVVFLHLNDFSGCDDIVTTIDVSGVHLPASGGSQQVHFKYVLTHLQDIDVALPAIHVSSLLIAKGAGSCTAVGDVSLLAQ